jgi:CO dehydrogenase/acetyl-CoA synthase alpha subunit
MGCNCCGIPIIKNNEETIERKTNENNNYNTNTRNKKNDLNDGNKYDEFSREYKTKGIQ